MGCHNRWYMTAIFAVLAGYYIYYPFPDNAVSPWQQMFFAVPSRLNTQYCLFLDYMGIDSYFNCSRRSISWIEPKRVNLSDDDLEVTETTFDGVRVRLYQPRNSEKPLPGFIYIHGGGWALLTVGMYDWFTRTIAHQSNAVVISIDYRLAPEHPFPIPLQDCLAATKHFIRNAQKFGVDPSRIGIGGDSAGGNLAMAAVLKLSKDPDESLRRLKQLTLIYPLLQSVDFNLPSHINYTTGPFVVNKYLEVLCVVNYAFGKTKYLEEFFRNEHMSKSLKTLAKERVDHSFLPESYLKLSKEIVANETSNDHISNEIGSVISSEEFSPLMASDENLKKLPKTYILTAEYDPLRDESTILTGRMRKLKLPVIHAHYDGVQHGFIAMRFPTKIQANAVNNYIAYLKSEL